MTNSVFVLNLNYIHLRMYCELTLSCNLFNYLVKHSHAFFSWVV
jgi:hypothetical protein